MYYYLCVCKFSRVAEMNDKMLDCVSSIVNRTVAMIMDNTICNHLGADYMENFQHGLSYSRVTSPSSPGLISMPARTTYARNNSSPGWNDYMRKILFQPG